MSSRLWLAAMLAGVLFLAACATTQGTEPVPIVTQAALTASPSETPTPAGNPARTPTLTSTMQPSLQVHQWHAETILVLLDGGGGDGGLPLPFPPDLVLYADGRLFYTAGLPDDWQQGQVLHTVLDNREVCAMLNTIDQIGYLDYDRSTYVDGFVIMGAGIDIIEVNAWRSRHDGYSGLSSYLRHERLGDDLSQHGAPTILPALRNVYYFLVNYRPDGMEIYLPEQLGVWISEAEDWMDIEEVSEWPLHSPSLFDLSQRSEIPSGYNLESPYTVLVGEEASLVFDAVGQSFGFFGDFYSEAGHTYRVLARPLLPYENPEYYSSFSDIPEDIILTCYPSDGQIQFDVPTPLPTYTPPRPTHTMLPTRTPRPSRTPTP